MKFRGKGTCMYKLCKACKNNVEHESEEICMLNYNLNFNFLFNYIKDNNLKTRYSERQGYYRSFPFEKLPFRMMSKREFCDIAVSYNVELHVLLAPHVVLCEEGIRERVYASIRKTYKQLKKSYPAKEHETAEKVTV